MSLITLQQAQLSFGHVALLDRAEFSLEIDERVGLIGRNGAGKSSLLRILGGLGKARRRRFARSAKPTRDLCGARAATRWRLRRCLKR